MDRLAEYRRNADGCRAMAENADDPGMNTVGGHQLNE